MPERDLRYNAGCLAQGRVFRGARWLCRCTRSGLPQQACTGKGEAAALSDGFAVCSDARANLLFVRAGFKLYLGGVVTLSGWVYRYARAGFDAASMQDLSMPPGVNCRYACTEGNAALRRFPLRSVGRLYRRAGKSGIAAAPLRGLPFARMLGRIYYLSERV